MKLSKPLARYSIGLLSIVSLSNVFAADSLTQALTSGKAYVDLRVRYEAVDQDNGLQDADALSLRTRLGYVTKEFQGFSAVIEAEDSRDLFGIDDYSVPPTGFKTGEYSVIADPETTEIDKAFVKYKSGGFTGVLGRQVITLDNHRFVGDVGWRQDRQSFDAVTIKYQVEESWSIQASQISQRNLIFAEESDIGSNDTIVNLSYQTSLGKLIAYAYLLEIDDIGENSNDTFGVRFAGSNKHAGNKTFYAAEYASQEANNAIDNDYLAVEGGFEFAGITAKLGFESLGSDNGEGAFSTPLATLHKFNGWTDQFLSTPRQGLEDLYLTVTGGLLMGKWSLSYHDFSSDIAAADGSDDLGSEINIVYLRKFGDHHSMGIKYGDYSAGSSAFAKVDTDKLWLWGGASF